MAVTINKYMKRDYNYNKLYGKQMSVNHNKISTKNNTELSPRMIQYRCFNAKALHGYHNSFSTSNVR